MGQTALICMSYLYDEGIHLQIHLLCADDLFQDGSCCGPNYNEVHIRRHRLEG